jgi:transaldolase
MKDPAGRDTMYVETLAAPDTIDTIPDKTLLAFADHGRIGALLPDDGGDAEATIAEFTKLGIDIDALALRLQKEGGESFTKSWQSLLDGIRAKSEQLAGAESR